MNLRKEVATLLPIALSEHPLYDIYLVLSYVDCLTEEEHSHYTSFLEWVKKDERHRRFGRNTIRERYQEWLDSIGDTKVKEHTWEADLQVTFTIIVPMKLKTPIDPRGYSRESLHKLVATEAIYKIKVEDLQASVTNISASSIRQI